MDVVDSKTRSRMMSGIKGKDTKPELIVRSLLFERGFRYRLHRGDLPGKPDLVLPKYRVAVFVNGCFWHGHECSLFKWPKTNKKFWKNKIGNNQTRDSKSEKELLNSGWHVLIVWECALKSKSDDQLSSLGDKIANWITARSSRPRKRNLK